MRAAAPDPNSNRRTAKKMRLDAPPGTGYPDNVFCEGHFQKYTAAAPGMRMFGSERNPAARLVYK